MAKFEVPIVYRGQSNYIVYADTAEKAEEIARGLFREGDMGEGPVHLGNEWEEIDHVGEIEKLED